MAMIGMVVGEHSGDILGAEIMAAILKQAPESQFVGIGGPKMIALGFQSLYDMEELSVMGFIEPLKRLPRLLSVLKGCVKSFEAHPIDIFVGVDAPDFNLRLSKKLKIKGLCPTIQAVSPSVWAWRQGRIKSIQQSVDHTLCLLPFEKAIYDENDALATFIGHPLADKIPLSNKSLPKKTKTIGLLAGSRGGELQHHIPVLIDVIQKQYRHAPDTHWVVPCANEKAVNRWETALKEHHIDMTQVSIIKQDTSKALSLMDVAICASGTVTLETLLMRVPMIIIYKMGTFNAWLARRLLKIPYIGLPNLLAGQKIVPELLQEDCRADNILKTLSELIDNEGLSKQLEKFDKIHQQLKQNAADKAAQVILNEL